MIGPIQSLGDLVIPALLVLLFAPLPVAMWMIATRRGGWPDALSAVLPHGVWQALAALGSQASLKTPYMTNLVLELPFVSLLVLIILTLRVRMAHRFGPLAGLALAIAAGAAVFVLVPPLRD